MTEPTTGWRLLPLEVGRAGALLDRGLALLEELAGDPTPTLRWYEASTPAIVLGRGQRGAAVSAAAVDIVTRFSGGGAVLLDENILSLDILLPTGHPLLDGDLSAVFPQVGQAWVRALRGLGAADLQVWSAPATARRRGSDRDQLLAAVCYATLGRGEVLAGGRKLVGLAQRRRRQGALVQCGLLRRWRPARLLQALGIDPDDADITRHAVGLDELSAQPPVITDVMRSVERELATSCSETGPFAIC
ncbi:MAG: lipoate--protein ligase family protein [Egibacteraceae bacterium]